MPITADQMRKLLAGVKFSERAEIAGVVPETPNERRIMQHIEASNITMARAEAIESRFIDQALEKQKHHNIQLADAPLTIEESGLTAEGFEFDESQLAALAKLTRVLVVGDKEGKHTCLIGAAGTGKTTLVKHALAQIIFGKDGKPGLGIRQLSGDQGPSIAICAFTGIATQVIRATLPAWIHPAVKTIHSLLEYKPSMGAENEKGRKTMFLPTRNAGNKLDHDVVIFDEASMVGLDLWHNFIDALRPGTIVILIGDLNQLKPVADATMFAYALSAGIDQKDGWDIAELTTIHRQKEPEANRIIDAAHAILVGKTPTFDNPKEPGWRVMGYELPIQAQTAHTKIIEAIEILRRMPTPGNPERKIFDPYKDLLLTAGNGFDENNTASFVQQAPLNNSLSRIIEPQTDTHPIYVIDAGRDTKRFAVGHRVMATKNESPATKDRVTNGLTGRITDIKPNANWHGNRAQFGTEKEVLNFRREQAKLLMSNNKLGVDLEAFSLTDTSEMEAKLPQDEEKQASHIIDVAFANGAVRTYRTAIDVGSIQLAYAMTTHKAQGSQADTVIIIVHQAVKSQLNREWFYTAVTRARRRVIILYTRMGMATAVSRQQIFGKNLREKVQRYRQVMETGNVFVRLKARDVTFERELEDRISHDMGEEEEEVFNGTEQ